MESYVSYDLFDESGKFLKSSMTKFSIDCHIMLYKGLCVNVETIESNDDSKLIRTNIYTFQDGTKWTCEENKWN